MMETGTMTGLNELLAGRQVAKLEDGMTIEQWTEHGRSLFAAEKQISWAIADWWAFGDQHYGERAKLAAEGIFGRKFQSLADAGSVARAFPEGSRQHEVSFTGHRETAALARENPAAAAALLDTAAEGGMSARDLREAQKTERADYQPRPIAPPDHDSLLSSFLHHWNRLPRDVRLVAAEMIESANGEVIDPA